MNQDPAILRIFIRYSRPAVLGAGILFYILGLGIARYLGHTLNWPRLLLGLAAILMLLMTSHYLKAYYDILETSQPGWGKANPESEPERRMAALIPRQWMLMAAATTMTIGAAVTVVLVSMGAINLPVLLILGLGFLIAFFYGVPPLRLARSGYGEFSEAVLVANLIPAFGFMLQVGEMHRLLAMITFPLLALYLAACLALSLENYLLDIKFGRRTLMVLLGWQRGMNIHNLLILAAYLLLAASKVIGLPWQLTWPGLLTIPLGVFAIFQMTQISAGARPAWKVLNFTAAALPALTAYLVALALWTV